MNFADSIKSCFSNYATFGGRASRSEFWWWQLFCLLAISALLFTGPGVFLSLVLILPSWAVGVRRLHDIDKSGWNLLWYAIPLIALVLLFVWNCRKGTDGDNDYGHDPLEGSTPMNAPFPRSNVADKAEQLSKLKALLESGAVTQNEFDRMKADLLAG